MNPFQNPNPAIRDITADPEIGGAMRKVSIEQLRPACFLVSLNRKPLAEFSELADAQAYAKRWGWRPSGETVGPPPIVPPRNTANESRGGRNAVEIVEPWKGCWRVTKNGAPESDWCDEQAARARARSLGWRPPVTAANSSTKKRFDVKVDGKCVVRGVPERAATHYRACVAPQLRAIGHHMELQVCNECSVRFPTKFA